MSRFTVLVIGPNGPRELNKVLAPYDEHLIFPPYIKFTREDKKAEKKRLIKYYKAELRKTPNNTSFQRELIVLQGWTDEQFFHHYTLFYSESRLNAAGEPISTYNPNSRWSSWEYVKELYFKNMPIYMLGMQKKYVDWARMAAIKQKQAQLNWHMMFSPGFPEPTTTEKTNNDYWEGETQEQYKEKSKHFLTHAYILRGKWYERNKVGWWAKSLETMDREKWINQYRKMLTQVKSDTQLTTIECRI